MTREIPTVTEKRDCYRKELQKKTKKRNNLQILKVQSYFKYSSLHYFVTFTNPRNQLGARGGETGIFEHSNIQILNRQVTSITRVKLFFFFFSFFFFTRKNYWSDIKIEYMAYFSARAFIRDIPLQDKEAQKRRSTQLFQISSSAFNYVKMERDGRVTKMSSELCGLLIMSFVMRCWYARSLRWRLSRACKIYKTRVCATIFSIVKRFDERRDILSICSYCKRYKYILSPVIKLFPAVTHCNTH